MIFYNSLPFHLCKLDFARLLLLYEFGGIYADLDMYCYKNFYNFIEKDVALCQDGDFLFGDHGIAMNNLMISDKNNNFILAYINDIMNNYYQYHEHITKQMYCFDLTIFQITRTYLRYENKQNVQILPYELFAPQPLSYDENMFTKHMHTYIHGKEEIEKIKNTDTHISLEEKYKKIYKERPINIAIDDWDFYKTYTRYR